jgi:hypothetical protein
LPNNARTIGSWLTWWLDNVAGDQLKAHSLSQYRAVVASVNADSALTKLPLSEATPTALYLFYLRELKKQLPASWAKRIYRFARYALAAAARAGLAPKYPKGRDFWMVGHRVARVLSATLGAAGILVLILAIFAGFRVVRDKEDWLTAGATVARENGLGVVVAAVEDIYYGYIKVPLVGGTPTSGAQFGGGGDSSPTATQTATATFAPLAFVSAWGPALSPSEVPPPVSTPVDPVADEGQWQPTLIKVNGTTAIRVARVRPDSIHTSYFATIAWLDPKLLAFAQIPGTEIPEGNYDHGTGQVPADLAQHYVAGLCDGFLMRDSQGGYILDGKVIKRMVDGKATLITYTDGSIDVVQWGRDAITKPIQAARQNLQLTVDGGQSQVHDESQSKWGWVWEGIGSGKNLVWRSGLGIRADGSVVFVIGDALSARTLSDLLVRAGAVRALPLDMNSAYANGFLYGPYKGGLRLDPKIYRQPDRFLVPSERDFIAVFMKSPAEPASTR